MFFNDMNEESVYTPTYILTWNPKRFHWTDYESLPSIIKQNGAISYDWSCRSKKPKPNDRFILLMQGMGDLNGIVGCGHILSSVYDIPFNQYGKFVDISLEYVWNYKHDDYIKTAWLRESFDQCWTPQSSGTRIQSKFLPDLWKKINKYKMS